MSNFHVLVSAATFGQFQPYAYQARLADEGLPELLRVPTGAGKTLAAVLPWLYRRRMHPDPEIRESTPRRLVVVLPQRSLVEQTHRQVSKWLTNLEASPPVASWGAMGLHVLMGGSSSDDREWKVNPVQDAVFIGTQDMVLSRLLCRGYGEGRAAWPMSFGFLHSDTQFVIDEVQLMGPGLGTSIQVEGLRRKLGTAMGSSTMWMSATLDPARLSGFPDYLDLIERGLCVELADADRVGPLAVRLHGTRAVAEAQLVPAELKRYPQALAERAMSGHAAGTRTIVMVNTVARARQVHAAMRSLSQQRAGKSQPVPVVLLHSRFRPGERSRQISQVLADPPAQGVAVISSQVLEAGVDVSARLMITELAPWSSIVQRAGRCNRAGTDKDAQLWWVKPPGRDGHRPYEEDDLEAAQEFLRTLEGSAVTSTQLQDAAVAEASGDYSILRKQDLIDLFDTSPDLDGNDIDISRWVRDADERTVGVAWRPLSTAPLGHDSAPVGREELCQVPIGELRELLARNRSAKPALPSTAWIRNVRTKDWRPSGDDEIRPGGIVVLDEAAGGYDLNIGWDPASRTPVPAVVVTQAEQPWTPTTHAPVSLTQHLDDVGRAVDALLSDFGDISGLSAAQKQAAVAAGFLHDLGKAHPAFQQALEAWLPQGSAPGTVWAKSGTTGRLSMPRERAGLRHELASALMFLSPDSDLMKGVDEVDLAAFLIAAHHGKVRVGVNPAQGEAETITLGIRTGDTTVPVELTDGRRIPELTLSTSLLRIGGLEGTPSWVQRVARLRDRPDLGPFRLTFLEAVVRSADWAVSATYGTPDGPAQEDATCAGETSLVAPAGLTEPATATMKGIAL